MRHPQVWTSLVIIGLLVGAAPGLHAASSSETIGVRIIIPERGPAPEAHTELEPARPDPAALPLARPMEHSTTEVLEGGQVTILHTTIERL